MRKQINNKIKLFFTSMANRSPVGKIGIEWKMLTQASLIYDLRVSLAQDPPTDTNSNTNDPQILYIRMTLVLGN